MITLSTNLTATFSQRALGTNRARSLAQQEKLSSGSRINHGADDAAGLAISEKNRASIRSLAQAGRNVQDAFGFVNTADSAIGEVGKIVTRLRELAIQAASDTIGAEERRMIEEEVKQLKGEITRIAVSTEYNGAHMLSGIGHPIDLQVGKDNDASASRITVDAGDFDTTLETLGLDELSLLDKEQARLGIGSLDDAQEILSDSRASLGAIQNRLAATGYSISNYGLNLSAANSRIRDTDMAEEVSELTKQNIINEANVAAMSQINHAPKQALKLLGKQE